MVCFRSRSDKRSPPSAFSDKDGETNLSQKRACSATKESQPPTKIMREGCNGRKTEKSTKACGNGKTDQDERMEGQKHGAEEPQDTPVVIVTKAPSEATKGDSTKEHTKGQSPGCKRAESVEMPQNEAAQNKQAKNAGEACTTELPASVCKRGSCGSPKLPSRCAASTCTSKTRSLPEFGLWSESGRLRQLSTICYCDSCMGFKVSTCSSPRMAQLRKTNTGRASLGPRSTKTE